jgi:hypothetical protein
MAQVTTTKLQVIAVAAELADPALSADQWALVLSMVREEVNVAAYPTPAKADMAALYLAAHKAVKTVVAKKVGSGASAEVGTVSSVTVGSVTKSYTKNLLSLTTSLNEREFLTTTYGREYLRLARQWVQRMFLA